MIRRKRAGQETDLFDLSERLTTAPCVPKIRKAVAKWKHNNYPGITKTTRELLNFWFYSDHKLPNGDPFRYYESQQAAIETLIYLYEVEKVRSRRDLLEKYAVQQKDLRMPPSDDFARYCIKMATGSGKTKVMALAIAWQYFNAMRENDQEYAKTFLILAPNVIVFERLKLDFANGKIFRIDPLFPRHYELFWDMEFYMRSDPERAASAGAVYLTNIQQFYERAEQNNSEPDPMLAVMGHRPQANKLEITDFDERIIKRHEKLLVINDEAHHTHDEKNEWNNVIHKLHESCPLISQLDYSATPRYSKGSLFAWTVFDYPLKQAIMDNIVKRPVKGISKAREARSDHAEVRYEPFLVAGVERWKEYAAQLKPLKRKPILFIMMNSTQEADDIADWLRRKYNESFGGDKTLVIHTNKSGDIAVKDLDDARQKSREVDEDDSPVNAIVSVLMLREGWDVKNVTVVVGLRPYTAKANILPEQTIGRGLRLMFRSDPGGYREQVDIIGNQAFLDFVSDLERLEDLKFDTFEIGKDKLQIITIMPVDEKMNMDIGIPELSPSLVRKKSLAEEINAIDVRSFKSPNLPEVEKSSEIKTFMYEGIDILTNEKLFERQYDMPPAQTAGEVIGYYARKIAHDLKLPSQFALLAPKIKEYFQYVAFGREVDLEDSKIIRAMSTNVANYVVCNVFEKALRDRIVSETVPELLTPLRMLSSTEPFSFSRLLIESRKTVFNYVACENEYERDFAKFLDQASDIKAFAKLPFNFGFSVAYTDTRANMRNYYPDFIVKRSDTEYWLIETKGREDLDVIMKDQAAMRWCENATNLTGKHWQYLKVGQNEFGKLKPENFGELVSGLSLF